MKFYKIFLKKCIPHPNKCRHSYRARGEIPGAYSVFLVFFSKNLHYFAPQP